jgi:hypothetical protein
MLYKASAASVSFIPGGGVAGTKKRGISPAQRKKLLAAIKERIPVPGAAS